MAHQDSPEVVHTLFFPVAPAGTELHQCRFDRFEKVSPNEVPPFLRNAIHHRQREFAAGRFCAAQALKKLLGRVPEPVGVSPDRSPIWPSGVTGAITHADDMALAVVGPNVLYQGIGVDIEPKLTHARARQLSRRILAIGEDRTLSPDDDQFALLMTVTFSLKESLFKALNPMVKRVFGLQDASVVRIDWKAGTFLVELTKSLSTLYPQGRQFAGQFAIRGNYVATLVTVDLA